MRRLWLCFIALFVSLLHITTGKLSGFTNTEQWPPFGRTRKPRQVVAGGSETGEDIETETWTTHTRKSKHRGSAAASAVNYGTPYGPYGGGYGYPDYRRGGRNYYGYGGNNYGRNSYGGSSYRSDNYGGSSYGDRTYGGNTIGYGGSFGSGHSGYGRSRYGGSSYSGSSYGGSNYGSSGYDGGISALPVMGGAPVPVSGVAGGAPPGAMYGPGVMPFGGTYLGRPYGYGSHGGWGGLLSSLFGGLGNLLHIESGKQVEAGGGALGAGAQGSSGFSLTLG